MSSSPAVIAESPRPVAAASSTASPEPRLMSVDALRGFDMFWILGAATLVRGLEAMSDNAVTRFLSAQLEHATWEGVHFYDVIYPLFLFLIGVSIVFSLDRSLRRDGRPAVIGRILRRGLLLYVFNFIYNGGFTTRWPDMRVISGVLGMIAVCYVFAALLYCFLADRLKVLVGVTVALLLGYWALLGWVPFPDFHLDQKTVTALATKAGSHSPAAIAAAVPQRVSGVYEEGRNLSNYLDFRYIPGALPNKYYENQGLLSPLCAVTVCLFGIFAGRWLKRIEIPPLRKVAWLASAGVAAALLGWIWGLEFPVVKRLWTSSFCLVTGGYAAIALAVFYLIVDVWNYRRWCAMFVWIGMNPITLYMLSAVVSFEKIATRLAGGDIKALLNHVAKGLGNLTVAIVTLALVVWLARFLYRRSIFLRV